MILPILSLIAGVAFIAGGIYFLSEKFLQKINEATPNLNEESIRKNTFRAKGTGYVSFSVGALTFVFAIMLFMFPALATALALFYMIMLVFAFLSLVIIYR